MRFTFTPLASAAYVGAIVATHAPLTTVLSQSVGRTQFHTEIHASQRANVVKIVGLSDILISNSKDALAKAVDGEGSRQMYPRYMAFGVAATVAASAVGVVVGYLYPGPITGAILPLALTLWWCLSRLVTGRERDQVPQ